MLQRQPFAQAGGIAVAAQVQSSSTRKAWLAATPVHSGCGTRTPCAAASARSAAASASNIGKHCTRFALTK